MYSPSSCLKSFRLKSEALWSSARLIFNLSSVAVSVLVTSSGLRVVHLQSLVTRKMLFFFQSANRRMVCGYTLRILNRNRWLWIKYLIWPVVRTTVSSHNQNILNLQYYQAENVHIWEAWLQICCRFISCWSLLTKVCCFSYRLSG